ncbi:MAG: tRNA-(ms[2]io[6]A)-hydroxylase [Saprospirales bacterium]|nr:tRNA-(ms[2]io[6]A)-hydroxylase [Saprospirales bacterium]MBK8492055.1 tRNA-(ms[2]io[6]A)-hydroxylase [Saprospirales bacterium]
MKLNLDVATPSKPEWIKAVMADFDSFLQDHADCERKASAMALSMVAKYPDRVEIIPELIETALEEMEHFRDVYAVLAERGIQLAHQIPEDLYMKQLLKRCHSGRLERFLDRLLIGSIVETRGAERFRLVEEALEEGALKRFYKMLWTSEAKHGHIYVKMALNYFPEDQVYNRLEWWVEQESEIIDGLEIRAALH